MTSSTKSIGLARSTAVASGVRCRKAKALGPEKAWPMATVYQGEVAPVRAVRTVLNFEKNSLLNGKIPSSVENFVVMYSASVRPGSSTCEKGS